MHVCKQCASDMCACLCACACARCVRRVLMHVCMLRHAMCKRAHARCACLCVRARVCLCVYVCVGACVARSCTLICACSRVYVMCAWSCVFCIVHARVHFFLSAYMPGSLCTQCLPACTCTHATPLISTYRM